MSVFDSAGDDFDDYIRTEALLLGARLYPDSFPLFERRAIYYLDTDTRFFTKFMHDNADVSSNMFDILRLNLYATESVGELEARASELLGHLRSLDDEEVIQFVQTAHSIGLDKWLVDNLDVFREKVRYLPTLLYEYAYQAEESAELVEVAAKVLEELTEIEPYVADYWTMLALAYIRDERFEDASSAIGYALAIEPNDFNALKAKLFMANTDNDAKAVLETSRHILDKYPDDREAAAIASIMLTDDGSANEFISGLSPEARASRTLIMRAISSDYPKIGELISDALDYGISSDEDWHTIADFAYEKGNFAVINEIMIAFEKKTGRPLNHDYLNFRMMFDLGNYPLVVRIFTEAEPGGTLRRPENLYVCYSIFLVALLRMGDINGAKYAALSLLKMLDTDSSMVGSHLEQQAMREHLNDILSKINSQETTDWSKFNPIC